MEIRHSWNPKDVMFYTTAELRDEFLIQDLFVSGQIKTVYSHVDRIIVGGVCPTTEGLALKAGKELGVDYFLERRELGIINIGADGIVTLDGEKYELKHHDGLYVGMGTKEVIFESLDQNNPAKFYLNSTPAHRKCPTVKIDITKAAANPLGSEAESNKRTIYQYIHPAVMETCQLLMGLTVLEPNNIWNTMPCHTHDRRMEVYLYFDMEPNDVVFHMMGEPDQTRHIVVRNQQAVISPSWSIHSGVGTRRYTFIWGMAGENQTFTDMDVVNMTDLN